MIETLKEQTKSMCTRFEKFKDKLADLSAIVKKNFSRAAKERVI